MTKKALITGISGQDGSYLAKLLLEKSYEVHGIVRPETLATAINSPSHLQDLFERVTFHIGLLENPLSLSKAIRDVGPDECYHLAGPGVVDVSFEEEPAILAAIAGGTHSLLAAIRELALHCRFFLAGSSEMFGLAETSPQNEATPFNPRSIYGLAKLSGHHIVRHYRDHYGVFGCTGLLYNHESPRRSARFVTRKVTLAAARIKLGLQNELPLGNLDAVRDWGYAPEYVEAMWRMLQNDEPEDFIVATGVTRPVRELVETAFSYVGLDYRDHVTFDECLHREPERIPLRGDPTRIERRLGWGARKPFPDIIAEMIDADLQRVKADPLVESEPLPQRRSLGG